MTTTPETTQAEDEAAARFYGSVSFDQSGKKLDAMKETQKEIEDAEEEENSDE